MGTVRASLPPHAPSFPSLIIPGTAVGISPLLLANAGLSPGDTTSVSTLEASGVELLEAKEVVLIYDGKGRAVKEDSFFEAYARETLSAFTPVLFFARKESLLTISHEQRTSSSSLSTISSSYSSTGSSGAASSLPPKALPYLRPSLQLPPPPPPVLPRPTYARNKSMSSPPPPKSPSYPLRPLLPPRSGNGLAMRRTGRNLLQRGWGRKGSCRGTSRLGEWRVRLSRLGRWWNGR